MSVTVKIFTKVGGRPSLYAAREFETLPMSIGRDPACSMVLADPHKHISRFHVELEQQDSAYWMTVVSKVNPVMVKGRRHGPGTRLRLQSGDSFEIGEYEVQVVLPELPPPEPSLFDEPTFVGGDVGSREAKPSGVASGGAPGPELLRAFFDGAGLSGKDLPPAQAERLMRECGAILRAAVEGLMTLLIAHGEMRKKLQAEERTTGPVRDNNPLKLMSDPREAMAFLFDLVERTDGFLDPVQAIGDACEDLRVHELALMAGMRAAVLAAQQQKLAQEAQDDFQKVFGRDFMGAYQAELRRLKGGR